MKHTALFAAAFVAVLALIPLQPARAETRVWTNVVGNANWSNTTNWVNGIPVDGDSVVLLRHPLGQAVTAINDLTNLTLQAIACEAPGYTIAGGTLRLSGNVTIGGPQAGASLGISAPLEILGPATTFLGTNGGALTLSGVVNAPAGSVVTINAPSLSFRILQSSEYRAETRLPAGFLTLLSTRIKGPLVIGGTTNNASLVLQSGSLFADFPPLTILTNGAVFNISTFNTVGPFTLNGGVARLGAAAPNGRIAVNGDALLVGGASIFINATSDFGPGELSVTGLVAIAGCTLAFQPGSFSFTKPGVILRNDSIDPVLGTFTGLPEGSILTNGAIRYVLSYAGGDGNDVMLSPIVEPPLLTGVGRSNDLVQFTMQGQPGFTYRFEATSNLRDPLAWTPIRTNNAPPNGLLQFSDPDTGSFPQRFYRAVKP